jgi:hypothetical protein
MPPRGGTPTPAGGGGGEGGAGAGGAGAGAEIARLYASVGLDASEFLAEIANIESATAEVASRQTQYVRAIQQQWQRMGQGGAASGYLRSIEQAVQGGQSLAQAFAGANTSMQRTQQTLANIGEALRATGGNTQASGLLRTSQALMRAGASVEDTFSALKQMRYSTQDIQNVLGPLTQGIGQATAAQKGLNAAVAEGNDLQREQQRIARAEAQLASQARSIQRRSAAPEVEARVRALRRFQDPNLDWAERTRAFSGRAGGEFMAAAQKAALTDTVSILGSRYRVTRQNETQVRALAAAEAELIARERQLQQEITGTARAYAESAAQYERFMGQAAQRTGVGTFRAEERQAQQQIARFAQGAYYRPEAPTPPEAGGYLPIVGVGAPPPVASRTGVRTSRRGAPAGAAAGVGAPVPAPAAAPPQTAAPTPAPTPAPTRQEAYSQLLRQQQQLERETGLPVFRGGQTARPRGVSAEEWQSYFQIGGGGGAPSESTLTEVAADIKSEIDALDVQIKSGSSALRVGRESGGMSRPERQAAAASLTRDKFRLEQLRARLSAEQRQGPTNPPIQRYGDEPEEAEYRAIGGVVGGGGRYIVGEQGPELFVPGRATGGPVTSPEGRVLQNVFAGDPLRGGRRALGFQGRRSRSLMAQLPGWKSPSYFEITPQTKTVPEQFRGMQRIRDNPNYQLEVNPRSGLGYVQWISVPEAQRGTGAGGGLYRDIAEQAAQRGWRIFSGLDRQRGARLSLERAASQGLVHVTRRPVGFDTSLLGGEGHRFLDEIMLPRATGGRVYPLGPRQLARQLTERAGTLAPSMALRELYTYFPRGALHLVQPAALGFQPGQELPNFAKPLAGFLERQGHVLRSGGLTPHQVAAGYLTTLASIRGREAPAGNVFQRLGGRIPGILSRGRGRGVVRPEDLMAHFLGQEENRHLYDKLFAGNAGPMQAAIEDLGNRSGFTFLRTPQAFQPAAPGSYSLHNIGAATAALNTAGRQGASPDEMSAILGSFQGVGYGKAGFLGQWLGYGRIPTVDTNVLQRWLGSERYGQVAQRAASATATGLGMRMRSLISGRYDEMRRMGVFPGLSEDIYNAIAHHVTFSTGVQAETTHQPVISTMESLGRARARGGEAGSGAYLVGEQGPELFVPERAGYVLNRKDTLRALGAEARQTGGPVYVPTAPYGVVGGRPPIGTFRTPTGVTAGQVQYGAANVATPVQAAAAESAARAWGELAAVQLTVINHYEQIARASQRSAEQQIAAAREVQDRALRSQPTQLARFIAQTQARALQGPTAQYGGAMFDVTAANRAQLVQARALEQTKAEQQRQAQEQFDEDARREQIRLRSSPAALQAQRQIAAAQPRRAPLVEGARAGEYVEVTPQNVQDVRRLRQERFSREQQAQQEQERAERATAPRTNIFRRIQGTIEGGIDPAQALTGRQANIVRIGAGLLGVPLGINVAAGLARLLHTALAQVADDAEHINRSFAQLAASMGGLTAQTRDFVSSLSTASGYLQTNVASSLALANNMTTTVGATTQQNQELTQIATQFAQLNNIPQEQLPQVTQQITQLAMRGGAAPALGISDIDRYLQQQGINVAGLTPQQATQQRIQALQAMGGRGMGAALGTPEGTAALQAEQAARNREEVQNVLGRGAGQALQNIGTAANSAISGLGHLVPGIQSQIDANNQLAQSTQAAATSASQAADNFTALGGAVAAARLDPVTGVLARLQAIQGNIATAGPIAEAYRAAPQLLTPAQIRGQAEIETEQAVAAQQAVQVAQARPGGEGAAERAELEKRYQDALVSGDQQRITDARELLNLHDRLTASMQAQVAATQAVQVAQIAQGRAQYQIDQITFADRRRQLDVANQQAAIQIGVLQLDSQIAQVGERQQLVQNRLTVASRDNLAIRRNVLQTQLDGLAAEQRLQDIQFQGQAAQAQLGAIGARMVRGTATAGDIGSIGDLAQQSINATLDAAEAQPEALAAAHKNVVAQRAQTRDELQRQLMPGGIIDLTQQQRDLEDIAMRLTERRTHEQNIADEIQRQLDIAVRQEQPQRTAAEQAKLIADQDFAAANNMLNWANAIKLGLDYTGDLHAAWQSIYNLVDQTINRAQQIGTYQAAGGVGTPQQPGGAPGAVINPGGGVGNQPYGPAVVPGAGGAAGGGDQIPQMSPVEQAAWLVAGGVGAGVGVYGVTHILPAVGGRILGAAGRALGLGGGPGGGRLGVQEAPTAVEGAPAAEAGAEAATSAAEAATGAEAAGAGAEAAAASAAEAAAVVEGGAAAAPEVAGAAGTAAAVAGGIGGGTLLAGGAVVAGSAATLYGIQQSAEQLNAMRAQLAGLPEEQRAAVLAEMDRRSQGQTLFGGDRQAMLNAILAGGAQNLQPATPEQIAAMRQSAEWRTQGPTGGQQFLQWAGGLFGGGQGQPDQAAAQAQTDAATDQTRAAQDQTTAANDQTTAAQQQAQAANQANDAAAQAAASVAQANDAAAAAAASAAQAQTAAAPGAPAPAPQLAPGQLPPGAEEPVPVPAAGPAPQDAQAQAQATDQLNAALQTEAAAQQSTADAAAAWLATLQATQEPLTSTATTAQNIADSTQSTSDSAAAWLQTIRDAQPPLNDTANLLAAMQQSAQQIDTSASSFSNSMAAVAANMANAAAAAAALRDMLAAAAQSVLEMGGGAPPPGQPPVAGVPTPAQPVAAPITTTAATQSGGVNFGNVQVNVQPQPGESNEQLIDDLTAEFRRQMIQVFQLANVPAAPSLAGVIAQ